MYKPNNIPGPSCAGSIPICDRLLIFPGTGRILDTMKHLNVGVIGLGDISDVYLNNLKHYPAVRLAACASRSLEKAQRHADHHGIPRAYASGADLIADPEIDIVLNLTTPDVHGFYNIAALAAGKHVYTEKPLAATLAEAREIMRIAGENGLRVGSAPDTFL
jgi:predicted dehydrogenase